MGIRILLIDDSEALRSVLASSLAAAGHEVLIAPSLVEATETLSGDLPDLAMVDLDLPGMNAEDAVNALHGVEGAAGLPVVLFSEDSARELAAKARRAGATGAIIKEKLPPAIDSWWEKYQIRQAQLSRPPTAAASFISLAPRPASSAPSAAAPLDASSSKSAAPSPTSRPQSCPSGLGFEGSVSAGGVLVVDDSPTQRFLLRDALEDAGVPVTCTGTVASAIEVLGKFKPKLILLDMNLPDMRGDEVCARLKKSLHFRDVRILFISGESEEVLQEATRRVGADGFLRKPFGIRELMSELTQVAEEAAKPPEQSWPLPVLIKALMDETPLARMRAARALGGRKERDGLVPLRSLLRDPVPEVVTEALWALGQMPDPTSMADIVMLFESTREVARAPEVRIRAVETLERLGGKHAVRVLGSFLEPDRSDEERLLAIQALSRIGDTSSQEPLQRVLFEEDSPVIQAAREALAAVKARSG